MFHVKKKNLENKVQKDQTKLNSLIAYQKKVKNICRNKKKYPVAYRAKFTVPATTSTIIKLAKKQGYIIQNKDKNSVNQNQL